MSSNGAAATVALYVRVSTEDQDLAGQERELREYAARRGWTVTRVYAEKTTATGRLERAAFEQLRVDAANPHPGWRRVLVWALDRWSREQSFVRAVGSIEELEVRGITWHSLKEPQLDSGEGGSASLTRDLLRGILPTIAKFESHRRAERTRVAMKEILDGRRPTRSGLPVGRPRRVTPELEEKIRRARWPEGAEAPVPWKQVALQVHLPWSTCAKVRRYPASEIPPSVKGQDGFRKVEGARVDLPARAR